MLIESLPYQSPSDVASLFAHMPGTILLESVAQHPELARFSYLAVDPFLTIKHDDSAINPFDQLEKLLNTFSVSSGQENILPGGVFGYFGYELNQYLENRISPIKTDVKCPDMVLGFYDLVVTFDHLKKEMYLVSNGFPEMKKEKQSERAEIRKRWFMAELKKTINHDVLDGSVVCEEVCQSFSKNEYCDFVKKVKNYILDGDIFEANISQRYSAKLSKNIDVFRLYEKSKGINPAPFSSFLNFDSVKIISCSPERFLKLKNNKVETRPIKGTRKRYKNREKDEASKHELIESEKDHAENIMIVDLMRNDLSRVCLPNTVKVTKLCGLETFETVHHLVSSIEGELHPELNAVDLLRATFPGGSITGAPKIRAMQIIQEIEETPRGPYCGAIGYIGFDGSMDTSITIRSFVICDNEISFHAGGAIVLDSDPEQEYEEVLAKSAALKQILTE